MPVPSTPTPKHVHAIHINRKTFQALISFHMKILGQLCLCCISVNNYVHLSEEKKSHARIHTVAGKLDKLRYNTLYNIHYEHKTVDDIKKAYLSTLGIIHMLSTSTVH